MDSLILRLEEIPLDGEDLIMMSEKLGNPNVSFMGYNELENVVNIFDIFKGTVQSVFILLDIRNDRDMRSIGHWVLLGKNKRKLYYYDPYGLNLGKDLVLTGSEPYLTMLLSKRELDVNHFRHQMFRDEINTCGRHLVVRAFFNYMTNDEYDKQVIRPLKTFVTDNDVFVTLMTGFLAKSDNVVAKFFQKKRVRPGGPRT